MNEKDYGILYEFLKPGIEKMYQYLYVSGNNVENYTDAVNAFDVFSKNNPEFIKAMVNSRRILFPVTGSGCIHDGVFGYVCSTRMDLGGE